MVKENEYIISSFKRLNKSLEVLNNEIIVLDFSHFSPCDKTKHSHYDIYFKSVASTEDYKAKYFDYIEGFVKRPESIWKKYAKGKQRLLYNFDNTNSCSNELGKDVYQNKKLKKFNVSVQNDFDAIEHLIKDFPQTSLLPGKCFIIYVEEHGDAQSIVYILLKEKIEIDPNSQVPIDLFHELPGQLKNFDAELHTLLIHEMVNSLVEEKTSLHRELQDLKTKMMFSLTTHSLKTHLNTTVIKEKNSFIRKLENHNELKEDFEKYLGKEITTLFRLTEILSLVDKINDKGMFVNAAIETELLCQSIVTYDLENHLAHFNRRNKIERSEPEIKINPAADYKSFTLPICIYGLYLGQHLIELFFNTLFENIVKHGKPQFGFRQLVINSEPNYIAFSNKTRDKNVPIDETNLTGNYRLFKKLFEETNSGALSIPPVIDHEFKLTITYGK